MWTWTPYHLCTSPLENLARQVIKLSTVTWTSSHLVYRFMCESCHNVKGTTRKANRYTAEKLPQNRMSEHIERRVNEYLRKNDTQSEAGYVHIRMVYSGDKSVEVKPGMKTRSVNSSISLFHSIIRNYFIDLLTTKKCLKVFLTNPKLSLLFNKLMVKRFVFLVFMSRSMVTHHHPTTVVFTCPIWTRYTFSNLDICVPIFITKSSLVI